MEKTITLQQVLKLSRGFGWIWTLPEHLQNIAEEIHDAWLDCVRKAERERHGEVRRVRAEIRAWAESPEMAPFAKAARLRYFKAQLKTANDEFLKMREQYIEARRLGIGTETIEKASLGLDKRIRGYEISIAVLEGRREEKNVITDEMIERAREFPIKQLLEIGYNGRAKCVFHQGEDFNMDIRKNFAYCYVCGESGDTIRVYRAKHGCEFREAVLSLQ